MVRMPHRFVTRRAWHAAAARPLAMVAVVLAAMLVAGEAFGCPNCKDAVNTSDPEGLNLARGYFYSILIMLAMPATLISSFGIYVWREMQRQKQSVAAPTDQTLGQTPTPCSAVAFASSPITPPTP
jgi:hypothetical protein